MPLAATAATLAMSSPNTMKSLRQSGLALTLKVNLAGYIPSLTLAPALPMDTDQSTAVLCLPRWGNRPCGKEGLAGLGSKPKSASDWTAAVPFRFNCCSQ
ncbi:MAG: hypothetical protein DMG24_07330 [Acidobacteria bacterium]|nr:MAG: hypothetical protein DMG24_07330 [Acidobacteriota bacterium]